MLGWYYRQYVFRFNPNYMKCKQAAHWFSLSGKFPLATSACNSMHFSIFSYKVKIDGKTCCWCYCKNSTNDDSRSNTGRWVSECHQFIYVRGFRIKLQFVDFAAAGEPNKKKRKFSCVVRTFSLNMCALLAFVVVRPGERRTICLRVLFQPTLLVWKLKLWSAVAENMHKKRVGCSWPHVVYVQYYGFRLKYLLSTVYHKLSSGSIVFSFCLDIDTR